MKQIPLRKVKPGDRIQEYPDRQVKRVYEYHDLFMVPRPWLEFDNGTKVPYTSMDELVGVERAS